MSSAIPQLESPLFLSPDWQREPENIFELPGTKTNRLALNARVKIVAGDVVQVDEVRSAGSYLSQNDPRVHFELGAHERVDRAKILWHSGKTETLTNLPADHFFAAKAKEGEGLVPREHLRPVPQLRH